MPKSEQKTKTYPLIPTEPETVEPQETSAPKTETNTETSPKTVETKTETSEPETVETTSAPETVETKTETSAETKTVDTKPTELDWLFNLIDSIKKGTFDPIKWPEFFNIPTPPQIVLIEMLELAKKYAAVKVKMKEFEYEQLKSKPSKGFFSHKI